jgi:hypothetical protein
MSKIEGIDTVQVGSILYLSFEYGKTPRWREVIVTGQTKLSWLVPSYYGHKIVKVNKKTLIEKDKYGGIQYYVLESQLQQINWIYLNRNRITNLVSYCNDVSVLQKIEALLSDKDQV